MSALLRILAWTLALALVALPVVAVLQGWIGADRWPLKTLRVTGDLEWIEDATLRRAVVPYAQHGFFAVDLAGAQAAVSALPWVEHAEVRKRWPDVLEVTLSEFRPFAHWGGERLLSSHGRLFPVPEVDTLPEMPRFDGPEARIPDVVALYNESRALFTPMGYEVERLAVDSRGSWSMTLSSAALSDGIEVVVGGQQARPRLERFARLLPRLTSDRPERLERADLRYTNGFALTWGEIPPETPDEDDAARTRGGATASLAPLSTRTHS
ncbi:cell division protein FtsQ/DivIB [Luteimonas abyssi]|uniref:cell division protein FtsQ/DivIB n=1 Tax=Luteimonas abyssi TaxID=1247514 RepID=UPI000737C47D|nr:cell division protein FtsQ/DivIB [Luteimonas abyssi]